MNFGGQSLAGGGYWSIKANQAGSASSWGHRDTCLSQESTVQCSARGYVSHYCDIIGRLLWGISARGARLEGHWTRGLADGAMDKRAVGKGSRIDVIFEVAGARVSRDTADSGTLRCSEFKGLSCSLCGFSRRAVDAVDFRVLTFLVLTFWAKIWCLCFACAAAVCCTPVNFPSGIEFVCC